MWRPLLALVSIPLLAGCTETVAGGPLAAEVGDLPEAERRVFDEFALEGEFGVTKILIENYNVPADDIDLIDCPPDQEVRQGNSFECVVVIAGQDNNVKITVVNDDGQYEVATPEPK